MNSFPLFDWKTIFVNHLQTGHPRHPTRRQSWSDEDSCRSHQMSLQHHQMMSPLSSALLLTTSCWLSLCMGIGRAGFSIGYGNSLAKCEEGALWIGGHHIIRKLKGNGPAAVVHRKYWSILGKHEVLSLCSGLTYMQCFI